MKLKQRIRLSIQRRAGSVVLRSELAPLGSPSQVSVALKELQSEGELIRMGLGVYAKAVRDAESGEVRPSADMKTLVRETAQKLRLAEGESVIAPLTQGESAGSIVLDTGHRRVSRKLSLGDQSLTYVNDRTRADNGSRSAREGGMRIPTTGVADYIRRLAKRYGVSYTETPGDRWAETVTRLAGDEIQSGPIQDLLVALKRAGRLSSFDMAALLVNYLREQKQRVRSVQGL